jgi:alpha-mannosidase
LKTVHLVCNAHIDPVWLWPWTAGLDEIINTCETVCSLLEDNPDVIFTRGETWVYEQIELLAPRLFRRILKLIARGQWEVVGGWYLQPDCNLPGEIGLTQQIALGRDYCRRTFGRFPLVGYNVDSFGHAPVLPRLMRAAGQRFYVMMRPQEHELALPARLFHWRGAKGDPSVLTFRIGGAYQNSWGLTGAHIEKSLTELPAGVNHTMAFIGIGDHGGGPTQDLIEWCRAHREAFPGARLEFSSPGRFFRAVEAEARQAPVVTGELQHHAIGCYSVHRPAKVGVHRGEHALIQAEEALRLAPRLAPSFRPRLEAAWRTLCFNHFHDALGGTCLPSAHAQLDAQLGGVRAVAEEIAASAARTTLARLPADPHQRLVIVNSTGADFSGWLEHEPWLEWTAWQPDWGLIDEQGAHVPHQVMAVEAVFGDCPRLLFRLDATRGATRVLRIVGGVTPSAAASTRSAAFQLRTAEPDRLVLVAGRQRWQLPQLQLVVDETDTWSHGVDRYAGRIVGRATWSAPRRVDDGPLMTAWRVDGRISRSRVALEVRRYAGEPCIELRLHVMWLETHRVLRLEWPQPRGIVAREDGVSGGNLRRAADGRERPVHDHTLLHLASGPAAGAVFPDVFSLSSTARALRLTLLRSAVMAHHTPHDGVKERRTISDQGAHIFQLRFYPSLTANPDATLARDTLALLRQPVIADLTKGMPRRAYRGKATALGLEA